MIILILMIMVKMNKIGRIIKQLSNDYFVDIGNEVVVCKPRGKFRNLGITPLVGDFVTIDYENCYLLEIEKRKNELIRPSIANVTQALIVNSVEIPEFSSNLLDKLLVTIEYNSVYNNDDPKLKEILKDNVTVFAGQSGAGKSTLLNMLDSSLDLKTGEVSQALGRGKHTTRHVELIPLYGGLVADTPGFSALDFKDYEDTAIRDGFIEFSHYNEFCKYRDCMHQQEEECGVKEAYKSGEILPSRYENYLKFLEKR